MANGSPKNKPPRYPKPPVRREPPDGSGGGAPGGDGMNWRSAALFSMCLMLLAVFLFARPGAGGAVQELAYSPEFVNALESGRIKSATVTIDNSTGEQKVKGKFVLAEDPKERDYWVAISLDFNRDLKELLAKHGVKQVATNYTTSWLAQGIFSFLPVLLILLVIYFMFRQQIKMAGRGAFSFGRSKGKMISRDKNRVMFKDVAGVEEAKEEVQEIVEFLKDPKKFQRLGGRIPKGVLMVGPPGTGKTLLAKAIAGEADVPFFTISGSDFVEMFVGVGASRVRDMFEQGKRNAPCLIFIDEIDAVGRSRGHGIGGGNDEREQTLNALLVEMDGFDTQEGVIIIAATNRKDVLDHALLRPGRFDREVRIHLPDIKGREEILKVHAKGVKLGSDVDLARIARGTPGYSGAELANVINEAALLAARRDKKAISQTEMEEARDKVRWGRERRSMAMTLEEKRNTAYHEAGHALLNVLLPGTDPLHKVSIIPRGPALGVTMMLPDQDRYSHYRKKLLTELCVTMGGRVAEELFLGDVSSGAAGDIQQATWRARQMVCEWGMSAKLGMVRYDEADEISLFAGKGRAHSEATQEEIDGEVKVLIDEAYNRATDIIQANRDKLEMVAQALLEYETLDGMMIEEIVKHGKMLNPPKTPKATPKPAATAVAGEQPKQPATDEDEDLPPALAPVPA